MQHPLNAQHNVKFSSAKGQMNVAGFEKMSHCQHQVDHLVGVEGRLREKIGKSIEEILDQRIGFQQVVIGAVDGKMQVIAGRNTGPDFCRYHSAEQPEQVAEAKQAMQEMISEALFELATELGRTMDFYRRQHGGQEVSRLLLSGGSAVIPGLADFLAAETGVSAEVARPYQYLLWDADKLSEAYLRDVGPATCVALGLAMRDMLPE